MEPNAVRRRYPPRRPGRVGLRSRPQERAQATVEFALVLPLVFLVMLVGVDVAVVTRDAVRVEHAAREAARSAAVDGDASLARATALRQLGPNATVDVLLAPPGGTVTATVRFDVADHLALMGKIRPNLSVSATIHMRREGDPEE